MNDEHKNFDKEIENVKSIQQKINSKESKKYNENFKLKTIMLDLIISAIAGGFFGYLLDDFFNTQKHILTIFCSIGGFFGGFYNLYKTIILNSKSVNSKL